MDLAVLQLTLEISLFSSIAMANGNVYASTSFVSSIPNDRKHQHRLAVPVPISNGIPRPVGRQA
jgi:hypothetical protein